MISIIVEKNTGNDRLAIQRAIDLAKEQDVGTVVLNGGEWIVDGTIYLHDTVRLVLDGAIVKNLGAENNIVFANYNTSKSYHSLIEFCQTHITVSGINGAKIIGGSILLSNVSFCLVEGVNFVDVNNFAIILASTLSVKVRDVSFENCANAVALGTGTRDCYFCNLSGNVKNNFFVIGDYLYEQFRRVHRYHMVLNVIIRNVTAKAKTFAYLYGRNVERIVFNNINAQVEDIVFDIRQGKHICVSGVTSNGKLVNDDVKENAVCFVD